MKYREEKCPICSFDDFFAVRKNDKIAGMYCKKCGQWIKWLSNKDVQNFIVAGDYKVQHSSFYGGVF